MAEAERRIYRKLQELNASGHLPDEDYVHFKKLMSMVGRLEEHLDFIGWGDSYERECSEGLRRDLLQLRGSP